MSVQKIKEETFLHICAFPLMDILLYVETHLDVVDGNRSLYRRTVSVEDHCETFLSHLLEKLNLWHIFQVFPSLFHPLVLLEPPCQVSLQQNGHVGQLQVSWQSKAPKYFEDNVMFMVRYSSEGLVKTARVVHSQKTPHESKHLSAQQNSTACLCDRGRPKRTSRWSLWRRVRRWRCRSPSSALWMQMRDTGAAGLSPSEPWRRKVQVSSNKAVTGIAIHRYRHPTMWPSPSAAARPVCSCTFRLSADISLLCVTPDLERVICQWNGSRYGQETEYKASYTMDLRWGDGFWRLSVEFRLPCCIECTASCSPLRTRRNPAVQPGPGQRGQSALLTGAAPSGAVSVETSPERSESNSPVLWSHSAERSTPKSSAWTTAVSDLF